MSARPLSPMRRRRGSRRPRRDRRFERELRERMAARGDISPPDGSEDRAVERARREGVLPPRA